MSARKEARQALALQRIGERWTTQLRAKADAPPVTSRAVDAASSSPLYDFWRYYSVRKPRA